MNKNTLLLYWEEVRHHKLTFFAMLLLIPIGATIIDSILPYYLSQAIGAISSGNSDELNKILWISGVIGLIGALFNYLGFYSMVIHESHMIRRLREKTFALLMLKDQAFFNDQKLGAMTSKYIDFVRSYVSIQDLLIIRTLGFILTLGSGLFILSMQSFLISGIVLLFIAVLVAEIKWSTRKRAPWRHERKSLVAEIHGNVADSLSNSLVVKSNAAEQREIESLKKLTKRFTKIYQKDIGFIVAEGSLRVFLMVIVQIIIIVVAVDLLRKGEIDIAAAVFVLAYMQRIGSQLFILGDIINGYDQAFLDAQPMTEMLLHKNAVSDEKNAIDFKINKPHIVFKDVSYSYPEGKEHVLSFINLDIPAGQKIGIVGHSGAGKSTFVQLLLRFSDVTNGSISINDTDIRHIKQTSLRHAISYVPQEPLLFHRTLRENIAYGKDDASNQEVTRAAELAHAIDFIEDMPRGFDTLVGERGVKLSGGQRQRIAIARAILKNAPILVLDEATSALDSESEKLIQDSLVDLMKDRTSIVIAHRLSTIAKLDRIIVLDNGQVAEDGTHSELLNKKGIYASLWSHQSGGFIEE